MNIKQGYGSPRWSGEFLDCSMPMTFDTYSSCSANCLYCFSFFQRQRLQDKPDNSSPQKINYRKKDPSCVNIKKIKNMFSGGESQFSEFIKLKKVMQWGGLADAFDMNEYKYGKTLELLKFFDEIDYPLSFSTKFCWWAQDARYINLFKKHSHNWHIKFSIINLDADRAKLMEGGIASPKQRLKTMKIISDLGINTTLRLRPFIIGFSNINNEHIKLIEESKKSGATSISTEFLCLESRASKYLINRYKKISKIIKFDIFKFYKIHSIGSGYYRLNYNIKTKFIKEMKNKCDELNIKMYVSDAHHKEKCENGSCCGLPENFNYSKGQFTEALIIAKLKGEVRFSDISKEAEYLSKILLKKAEGLNNKNLKSIASKNNFSLFDIMRNSWNDPKKQNSPYKYFFGILSPSGIDENGDIIYKFNKEKYEKSLL